MDYIPMDGRHRLRRQKEAVYENEVIPKLEKAKVIVEHKAEYTDELNLRPGDIVTIIRKDLSFKGWWKGKINDRVGIFPDYTVKTISNNESYGSATSRQPKQHEYINTSAFVSADDVNSGINKLSTRNMTSNKCMFRKEKSDFETSHRQPKQHEYINTSALVSADDVNQNSNQLDSKDLASSLFLQEKSGSEASQQQSKQHEYINTSAWVSADDANPSINKPNISLHTYVEMEDEGDSYLFERVSASNSIDSDYDNVMIKKNSNSESQETIVPVRLAKNEASCKLGLRNDRSYKLVLTAHSLILQNDDDGHSCILVWPIMDIRGFGRSKSTFTIEGGHKCGDGVGMFTFKDLDGYSFDTQVQQCRRLLKQRSSYARQRFNSE